MVNLQQTADVLAEIDDALPHLTGRDAAIHAAMATIARRLPHYDWVGVYILYEGVLNLGPYVGAHTDHTLIPVGKGVCGTAVAENRDIVVNDVRMLDNYLACSVNVRSEVVALIRAPETGQILGQIDADGHEVGAFDDSDAALLHAIGERLAPRLWSADD